MSSIPSHSGPLHQTSNINHSRNETCVNYTNDGQHASDRGIIYNFIKHDHQTSPKPKPLEELRKHCAPNAAFNSAARFDPPRCAESTRLGIIRLLDQWISSDGDNAIPSSFFWLYGGAGVGKSALAQSVSEKFQNDELAASFFFFRGDETRNNGNQLIPTLASQLVSTFQEIVPFVEDRIRKNWDLFTKIHQVQIQELLIEPLLRTLGTPPRLIVIDGLDECDSPDVQCELLRAIVSAIPRIPYPFRFLVTSRPEAHITHFFDHDHDLQAITVHRYNLSNDPDADMDIRKFLDQEFVDIRRVHRLRKHLPQTWPDQKAISSLVERSSGHFIYASTVIRYIRSLKHRPDDRLEVILRLRPPQEGDRPYAQLDALYALIFEGVESRCQLEKICLVLGILYFRSRGVGYFGLVHERTTIEALLEMRAGDLVLLLDPILSLVAVDGDGDEFRILHKSLADYLLDSTRGGHLPFDLARVHESAATYLLKEKIAKDVCTIEFFEKFSYHCHYACLNDNLKAYLQCLEVPCPKSVMTTPKTHPPWESGLNLPLRKLMWHFLRTLSREDFDPTGEVYVQYMTKWMAYLQSDVRSRRRRRRTGVAKVEGWLKWTCLKTPKLVANPEGVDVLERKIDTLLRQWKPKNFNPVDHGIDPVRRLEYVKQEHNLFKAYVEASSSSSNTNAIASSLVFDNDFIHSYNFDYGNANPRSPLLIQTYSRRDNSCFREGWGRQGPDAVTIQYHLYMVEMRLFSDMYQKFGIQDTFNI